MKYYGNYKDSIQESLDKLADILDPDNAAVKPSTYEDSVTSSLDRIASGYETVNTELGEMDSDIDDLKGDVEKIEGLPAVTADDNGKMLAVVNGEWALVTQGEYDLYVESLEAAASVDAGGTE